MNKACARAVGRIVVKAIEITEKHDLVVFTDYSGHCDLIEVSVRKSNKEYNDFLSHDFIYAKQHTDEELEERLARLYTHLCQIYRTGKLPEEVPMNMDAYEGSVRLA